MTGIEWPDVPKPKAPPMIVCSPEQPGMDGDVYHLPYIEAVAGKLHGYATSRGVQWTRSADHPEDPRCPECRGPRNVSEG